MSIPMVLLPVFVQVALTFVLHVLDGAMRAPRAISRRRGQIRDIALGQPAWPRSPHQGRRIATTTSSQLPLLFYVLVSLALITRKADLLFVVMSWLFVLLRVAHAYIHMTSNHVPTRFYVFARGSFVLLVMWIIFAVSRMIPKSGYRFSDSHAHDHDPPPAFPPPSRFSPTSRRAAVRPRRR